MGKVACITQVAIQPETYRNRLVIKTGNTMLHSVMWWDCIPLTCCAAAGLRVSRDDPRVAETAEVQAIAMVVVL